jgi:hypothetical protein
MRNPAPLLGFRPISQSDVSRFHQQIYPQPRQPSKKAFSQSHLAFGRAWLLHAQASLIVEDSWPSQKSPSIAR